MKVEMGLARPVFVCPFVQSSRQEAIILHLLSLRCPHFVKQPVVI